MDVARGDKPDHLPSALQLTMSKEKQGEQYPVDRRLPLCDRRLLYDDKVLQAISESLCHVSHVPWSVEPSSHLHVLLTDLAEILRRHAPNRQRPLLPHWMQERTRQLAEQKAQCASVAKTAHRDRKWVEQASYFYFLKYGTASQGSKELLCRQSASLTFVEHVHWHHVNQMSFFCCLDGCR